MKSDDMAGSQKSQLLLVAHRKGKDGSTKLSKIQNGSNGVQKSDIDVQSLSGLAHVVTV